MRVSSCAMIFLLMLLSVWPAIGQPQDAVASLLLACDQAAASPSDNYRSPGIAGVHKVDPHNAIAACEAAAAAAPGDPRLMFQLGRAYAAAKSYEAARVQLSKASDLGYAAAQANLGSFYSSGLGGLAKDDQKALRLFQGAAAQGDGLGTSNLGFFYETARGGLSKDEREAARLYKLAVDRGEPWGQYNLGRFYQNGRGGLAQDDREAARLYKLAADQGHDLAENSLGFLYETGRGGLSKDDREAVVYYKRAADHGNASGQNNLGRFYLNGRGGLPQNDEEAARLYQLAAGQGNVFAEANLGFLYEAGRGGLPVDDVEAARRYHRAAERGEPFAQNKLAMFYEEGRGGLPKDVAEATRLYKLAAEQDGNPNQKQQATEALRRLSVSIATTSPSAPSDQQLGMPVIGFLTSSGPSAGGFNISPFRSALKEAGYVEGNNVAIDFRWANNQREMNELAANLVRHRVKVIFANGLEAALAAKTATETIPIVFSTGGDPVELGLTASINRPAGNLTGVAIQNAELTAKRLDLLHQLVPAAEAIAVFMGTEGHPYTRAETRDLLSAASVLGVRLLVLHPGTTSEIEAAFATLVEQKAGALLMCSCTLVDRNFRRIISLAASHALPTMFAFNGSVAAGGLASYGPIGTETQYLAGIYAGRILKGEKPADLPVVQPTKFQFVINLRTAKQLGLKVPPALIAIADRVIE